MALTLYPDTGYDAFIAVADCDTFLSLNVPSSQRTAYVALSEADKEILIRQATTLIKSKITLPSTLEQTLQDATAYLVNFSVDTVMTNSDGEQGNVKRELIVGTIETEYFSQGKDSNSFPEIVDSLLSTYGIAQSGSFVFNRA